MFRRAPRSKVSSRGRVARAVASVMSPSGTLTFAADNFAIGWDTNEQTYSGIVDTTGNILSLNTWADLRPTLTAAIARVVSTPTAATVAIDPKFWVRSASLEALVTNVSQIDCEITFYPWVARYDTSSIAEFSYSSATDLEEKAGAATALGTPDTLGWTPFQSRTLVEGFRFGKPRKVKLQGGQSTTFKVKDNKPLYCNYHRLGSDINAFLFGGFANRTRGVCFTAKGIVSVDDSEPEVVAMTSGKVAVQAIRRYNWECVPTPYHFSDIVPDTSTPGDVAIIQPQTGAVNATPVSI